MRADPAGVMSRVLVRRTFVWKKKLYIKYCNRKRRERGNLSLGGARNDHVSCDTTPPVPFTGVNLRVGLPVSSIISSSPLCTETHNADPQRHVSRAKRHRNARKAA
eukprot:7139122-Prymnesium_polylepis.1